MRTKEGENLGVGGVEEVRGWEVRLYCEIFCMQENDLK